MPTSTAAATAGAIDAASAGVVGILLAAGSGSRFDPTGARYKLLQALPGGEPVVAVSARALLAAVPRVLAVVRPDDAATASLLRGLGCEVIPCARASEGMAASLVCGVQHAQDADGWLIALADMPYVRPATIAALAVAIAAAPADPMATGQAGRAQAAATQAAVDGAAAGAVGGAGQGAVRAGATAQVAAIAAPVHAGRRGNPVAFGRAHLPALLALEGDQGARSILKNNPVNELMVDDPGILRDIDAPSDIQ